MCECFKCCIVSCLVGVMIGGAIVISNKNIENLLKQGKDIATEKIEELKQSASEKLQESNKKSKNVEK